MSGTAWRFDRFRKVAPGRVDATTLRCRKTRDVNRHRPCTSLAGRPRTAHRPSGVTWGLVALGGLITFLERARVIPPGAGLRRCFAQGVTAGLPHPASPAARFATRRPSTTRPPLLHALRPGAANPGSAAQDRARPSRTSFGQLLLNVAGRSVAEPCGCSTAALSGGCSRPLPPVGRRPAAGRAFVVFLAGAHSHRSDVPSRADRPARVRAPAALSRGTQYSFRRSYGAVGRLGPRRLRSAAGER